MKRQKSIVSSSSFERRVKCPASSWFEEEEGFNIKTENTVRGSEMHAQLESCIKNWGKEEIKKYDREIIETVVLLSTSFNINEIKSEIDILYSDNERVYGTVDIFHADNKNKIITILDYKSGNTFVDYVFNYQLLFFACLAWLKYGDEFKYKTGIIQKDLNENSETYGKIVIGYYTFELDDIYYGLNLLNTIVDGYYKQVKFFNNGSHCHYCKAKHSCSAYTQVNSKSDIVFNSLEDIRKFFVENVNVEKLSLEEIESFYILCKQIEAKKYKAQELLLENEDNYEFKRLKFTPGRTTSVIIDEQGLIQEMMSRGFFPEDFTKISSQETISRLIGKKEFNKIKGKYFDKAEAKQKIIKIGE